MSFLANFGPTIGVFSPLVQTATFGASTLAGAGGWALPAGRTVSDYGGTGLTTTNGRLVSDAGGVTAGTVTLDNGQTIAVSTVDGYTAAASHLESPTCAQDWAELNAVLALADDGTLAYGSTIYLRGGTYGYARDAGATATVTPSGNWLPSGDWITDGRIVIRPAAGEVVRVYNLNWGGVRGVELRDLRGVIEPDEGGFDDPTADAAFNQIGPVNDCRMVNCRVYADDVPSLNDMNFVSAGIGFGEGKRNILEDCFVADVGSGYRVGGEDMVVQRNVATRVASDVVKGNSAIKKRMKIRWNVLESSTKEMWQGAVASVSWASSTYPVLTVQFEASVDVAALRDRFNAPDGRMSFENAPASLNGALDDIRAAVGGTYDLQPNGLWDATAKTLTINYSVAGYEPTAYGLEYATSYDTDGMLWGGTTAHADVIQLTSGRRIAPALSSVEFTSSDTVVFTFASLDAAVAANFESPFGGFRFDPGTGASLDATALAALEALDAEEGPFDLRGSAGVWNVVAKTLTLDVSAGWATSHGVTLDSPYSVTSYDMKFAEEGDNAGVEIVGNVIASFYVNTAGERRGQMAGVASDEPRAPYERLLIAGNIVTGSSANGIKPTGSRNAAILLNTLVGDPGDDGAVTPGIDTRQTSYPTVLPPAAGVTGYNIGANANTPESLFYDYANEALADDARETIATEFVTFNDYGANGLPASGDNGAALYAFARGLYTRAATTTLSSNIGHLGQPDLVDFDARTYDAAALWALRDTILEDMGSPQSASLPDDPDETQALRAFPDYGRPILMAVVGEMNSVSGELAVPTWGALGRSSGGVAFTQIAEAAQVSERQASIWALDGPRAHAEAPYGTIRFAAAAETLRSVIATALSPDGHTITGAVTDSDHPGSQSTALSLSLASLPEGALPMAGGMWVFAASPPTPDAGDATTWIDGGANFQGVLFRRPAAGSGSPTLDMSMTSGTSQWAAGAAAAFPTIAGMPRGVVADGAVAPYVTSPGLTDADSVIVAGAFVVTGTYSPTDLYFMGRTGVNWGVRYAPNSGTYGRISIRWRDAANVSDICNISANFASAPQPGDIITFAAQITSDGTSIVSASLNGATVVSNTSSNSTGLDLGLDDADIAILANRAANGTNPFLYPRDPSVDALKAKPQHILYGLAIATGKSAHTTGAALHSAVFDGVRWRGSPGTSVAGVSTAVWIGEAADFYAAGTTVGAVRDVAAGPASEYTDDAGALVAALFGAGEDGALFDPTAAASIYQDASKSVRADDAADPVRVIVDLHDAHEAIAASDAARPVLAAAYSRLGLAFDGVDDALSVTLPDLGSDATVAYVDSAVGVVVSGGQTISGATAWPGSGARTAGPVLWIDRALTDAERARVVAYLIERMPL